MNSPEAKAVYEALRKVIDPELDINIVDLGLIRSVDFEVEHTQADVGLTLTSPMCPMGPQIMDAVRRTAINVDGVSRCQVDLVWSPPWDPRTDASEDAKATMGIWD